MNQPTNEKELASMILIELNRLYPRSFKASCSDRANVFLMCGLSRQIEKTHPNRYLRGYDLVCFHLIERFGWLPAQVAEMRPDELVLVLRGLIGSTDSDDIPLTAEEQAFHDELMNNREDEQKLNLRHMDF